MSDRNDWILSVPPDCPDCGAPMQFVRRREYVNKPDAAEYRCPDCGSRLVTRESEERQRRELSADGHLAGTEGCLMSDLFQPEIVHDLRAQRRVREWIAALRGNEYPQACDYLRTQSGFCCLGVACNQLDDLIWRQSGAAGASWSYLGAITDLAKPVMDAYRLRRPDGHYTREDGSTASLAGDNDAGKSFAEIADLIERELEAALGGGGKAR